MKVVLQKDGEEDRSLPYGVLAGEAQKLHQAGVKDEFYATLAAGLADGQVIVFENEDPSAQLTSGLSRYHFTKTSLGRYGFFPRA